MFTGTLNDRTITFTPVDILSIQPVWGHENELTYVRLQKVKGVNRKDKVVVELSTEDIVEKIRELNGENLGTPNVPLGDSFFIPSIAILRASEDTAHKRFCSKCGYIAQVYHTYRCGCKIEPEFKGKIKGNSITKQAVTITKEDYDGLSSYNRWDENISLRTVSNIRLDEDGSVIGDVKVKDKTFTVTNCQRHVLPNEEIKVKPMRLDWYVA